MLLLHIECNPEDLLFFVTWVAMLEEAELHIMSQGSKYCAGMIIPA
jgi:hypothetical protein